MPNLAGKILPYIKGLGSSVAGFGKRFNSEFAAVGGYRSLFQNRTALGAIAGGAYGAYRGDNYSAGSIAGGALAGAGLARYGGMFMRSGMRSGIGLRGAAMRTAAIARADGRASARFIGRTAMRANSGYRSIRGLGNLRRFM